MASVAKVVAVIATQLFLLDAVADTHLGTDTLRGGGLSFGATGSWTSRALGTSRGGGVVASFATPTNTSVGDPARPSWRVAESISNGLVLPLRRM